MNKQNEGQITAIQHGAGPMLILAGPGSGKTYVITHRIKHLISECDIPPNNILVLTFTKAAALEMQTRACLLLPSCAYVQFGTFHSVFYRILCTSTQCKSLTLASDKERMDFVLSMLKESAAEKAEACLKEISHKKNQLYGEYQMSSHEFEMIYREYELWLKENNRLDFDDMVRACYIYLKEHKEEQKAWQNRFSYLLIDEFQDINPLQYETVKLLCGNHNIFAVGDDDQAIYGFRGSDPQIMKQFVKEYSAQIVNLSYNYRCCKEIVKKAGVFIEKNKKRFHKIIVPAKEEEGEVVIKAVAGRKEELAYIAEEIETYAKAYPNKSQAILTRTNGLLKQYQSLGEIKAANPLWDDINGYLRFINCGFMRKDFLLIMNKPMRYISRSVLKEETVDFKKIIKRLKEKPWIEKRVANLQKQMEFAKKLDICGQIRYIWNAMGYGGYKLETCTDEESCGNLKKHLIEILATARDIGDYQQLAEVMGERSGIENATQRNEEKENTTGFPKVSFMTYHGAKGLEFDRVYLPDLNYGKVPHGRMLTVDELEEERRMFYVAMTRAKESLVLIYDHKQKDSPFLTEFNQL